MLNIMCGTRNCKYWLYLSLYLFCIDYNISFIRHVSIKWNSYYTSHTLTTPLYLYNQYIYSTVQNIYYYSVLFLSLIDFKKRRFPILPVCWTLYCINWIIYTIYCMFTHNSKMCGLIWKIFFLFERYFLLMHLYHFHWNLMMEPESG